MCCKDCEQRHSSCHGSCDKYKAYRSKIDKANANRKNHYTIARAGYEITLRNKVRSNKSFGNMRIL